MKKPIVKIWNASISLSLIYYAIFLVWLTLSVSDLLDKIISNDDAQTWVIKILGYGFILFWVYLVLIPLRLTGIIRFEKKPFITMIILSAITIVVYIMTEIN